MRARQFDGTGVAEESQQHHRERGLARAARSHDGDALADREVEVDAAQHGFVGPRRLQPPAAQGQRRSGHGLGLPRIVHRLGCIEDLAEPAGGAAHALVDQRRGRQGGDDVVRREGQQRGHGQPDRVDATVHDRGDGRDETGEHRRALECGAESHAEAESR